MLLEGAFAAGLVLTVLALYLRLPNRHIPIYFVPLITVSHALLILAVEAEIVQHVAQGKAFEWWLSPLTAFAFALSIAATVEMLRSDHLRGLNHEVEGHRQR